MRGVQDLRRIGFDRLHRFLPDIGVHDGERRVKTFVAPNCDRLGQFVHLGR